MSEKIELRVRVSKKMSYNDESSWGAFGLTPLNNEDKIETLNHKFGNFVVTGNCQPLQEGNEYDIVIEPTEHPKYGKGYNFVEVKQKKPATVAEQQAYIRSMINEKQAEAIISKYPNELILDLMRDGKFNYSGIKGIKEKMYQKIKKQLFSNLNIQEAIVELKDLGITFKAMKRLIDHFGGADIVVQKVKENIYNLCEVKMFAFSKVDDYAMRRGDDKTSQFRIVAAIKHILNSESNDGHSWVGIKSMIEKAKDLLEIKEELITETLDHLKENSNGLYFDENRIAIESLYFYEKKIYEKLIDLMKSKSVVKIENADKKIESMEKQKGITFTDEQRRAIKLAIEYNIFVLNGKGGVGKTFSLQGILEAHSGYTYSCCALSGKASQIMTNHGLEASTIHRLLGVNPDRSFFHNSENPLPFNIIVVDEASMVNSHLFYSLISAIGEDCKLIILGDSGQLPAIGTAEIFGDILSTNVIPQQELTIVQRQAAKSGILYAANKIREGEQINGRYDYERKVVGELKDFVLFPMKDKTDLKELVLDICKKYKHKNVNEFQVITFLKDRGDLSVKKLNDELQGIFNDKSKPFVKRGGYEYRAGDKIIQNGNYYDAGISADINIFNGTLGQIIHIEANKDTGDKIWIRFDGIDEEIVYAKEELDMIELAYAITVHRSQGSSIPNVLFVFDYSAYKLLSRQGVYTGISRASKACVVACENAALHHAIRNDESGIRRTFLKEMLSNGI